MPQVLIYSPLDTLFHIKKNQQNSANFIENKYFQMTALVIYTVPNTLLLKPLTFRSPLTLGGLEQLKLTSLLLHCFTK